jgi:hypothetical protein
MKLFDVLKEDALRAFASNRNINVYVGPDSNDQELIKSIQRALAKHSLAKGERTEGNWWPNNDKAWTGGETGIFDANLGNAIRTWQESINIQIADLPANSTTRPLTVNGVINQEDGKILLAPLNNLGFLENRELQTALDNFVKIRRAFDENRFANGDVNNVTDYATFIQNIGRDGWAAVLTPIVNQRFTGQFEGTTADLIKDYVDDSIDSIMNKSRNVDLLFDNLRAILRPLPPTTKVPSKIAGDTTLIPGFERLRLLQTTYLGPNINREDLNKPKLLYIHFASIAQYQFERGSQTIQDRLQKQAEEDAKSEQNDVANIDQITARQLAEKIEEAFENRYFAVFTSARVESNDVSIEEAMMQLANAKDYDIVASEYNSLTGNNLSLRMVDELDEALYERIFVSHLLRIKRINPRIYHSAIQFGQQDSITVTAPNSDKEFEIMAVMTRTRPDIEPEVFDVILEDALLRSAIESTGGTLPDLYAAPTLDERISAINAFIDVMNNTYPEMVRFYAHLPPFAEYAPLGPLRLKGIIEEGTVYAKSGTDPTAFFESAIARDRQWLVGNGEDNDGDGEIDGGNANIYFDERYQDEGLGSRAFEIPDGEEEIALTDEELDIVRDLASQKEDIILAAIDLIFEQNNPSKLYIDTIYPGFKQQTGEFIEFELGGKGDNAWTNKFFSENTTDSNPLMAKLLTKFAESKGKSPLEVIAFVAPKGVADEFKKALDRTTFLGVFNNVDEEHLRRLVKSLVSREDFDLVDKYFDGDLQRVIEEKDWWRSDEDSLALLDKIGINPKEQDAEDNKEEIINSVDEISSVLDELQNFRGDIAGRGELISSINLLAFMKKLEELYKSVGLDDEYGNDNTIEDALSILEPYLFKYNDTSMNARLDAAFKDIPDFEEAREIYMTLWEEFN